MLVSNADIRYVLFSRNDVHEMKKKKFFVCVCECVCESHKWYSAQPISISWTQFLIHSACRLFLVADCVCIALARCSLHALRFFCFSFLLFYVHSTRTHGLSVAFVRVFCSVFCFGFFILCAVFFVDLFSLYVLLTLSAWFVTMIEWISVYMC